MAFSDKVFVVDDFCKPHMRAPCKRYRLSLIQQQGCDTLLPCHTYKEADNQTWQVTTSVATLLDIIISWNVGQFVVQFQ